MALGSVLFASMNFFARLASAHASWALVGAVRAGVGAAVAYAVARARSAPMRVKDRRGIWLRSAFGTGAMICTFYALGSPAISLGDAATLLNLTPVLVAVLAPFVLGERLERRVVLALPLSAAGIVLVLHPAFVFGGAPPTSRAALVAAAVAVAGSTSSACAMMMLRRIGPRESPEAIALHFSLVATAACVLLAAPTLREAPTARDLGAMLAAGLSAGLAQLAMTRAYALERAARVSGVGYLSVVVSTWLGIAFLGEAPHAGTLSGAALVIAGGLVVTVAGLRARAR